jgi:anti-sigma regulatory factor (Ser/Thr protein kinase)
MTFRAASIVATLAAIRAEPVTRFDVLALPCSTRAPGLARGRVRELCGRSRLGALTENAELVASELVSNAVRHGGGSIRLRVLVRDRDLLIAVDDDGDRLPRLPRLRAVGSWHTGGRGLGLVTELSGRVGVRPYPDGGKSVWSVLTLPDRADSAPMTSG